MRPGIVEPGENEKLTNPCCGMPDGSGFSEAEGKNEHRGEAILLAC